MTDASASTDCGSQLVTSLQVTIKLAFRPQVFVVDELSGSLTKFQTGHKKCQRKFRKRSPLAKGRKHAKAEETGMDPIASSVKT